MPDFDQVRELKARVQGRLFGIPGVHAVGVGHKIVNGQPTSDVAIMVFVVRKKPLGELAPKEVIPAEIEGVKTDVYESDMPRRHRTVVAGEQLEPGGPLGGGSAGTLGFFARKDDPVPRIFAVTCYHVVGAPEGSPTKLGVDIAETTITFVGANTLGSLVVVIVVVTPPGGPDSPRFEAFYVTTAADTLKSIASSVADRINATGVPNLTASFKEEVVTFKLSHGSTFKYDASVYGPHAADRSARLQAFVRDNQISMAGIAADPGGAYVNINVGGRRPTFGVFTPLAKGATPPANAEAVADALQNAHIPGLIVPGPDVTATATGSQITIIGAQEIECDVTTDVRVGQPTARFCSICSACCDRRIGRVVAARLDLDVALIQLDPGLEYKAEIAGIDGPISGTKPVTQTGVGVRIRGSVTTVPKNGTIFSLDQDGETEDLDQHHDPPKWRLFGSHYTGALSITPPDFATEGDSGAAVLSKDTNDIVGLHFAGTNKFALATPIGPILGAFGIVVETAAAKDVPKTVPAGAAMSVTELNATPVFAKALTERLQQAHLEIAATEAGAEFAAAVERHADEAQRLVNTNRRVATVWHRNGGPQIVQAVLGALQTPDRPLPQEIGGQPATACLRRIHGIFMRYGSAAFAADLNRLGPRLIELCRLSYNQMLAALQGPASPG
jgi:hypothetical protein